MSRVGASNLGIWPVLQKRGTRYEQHTSQESACIRALTTHELAKDILKMLPVETQYMPCRNVENLRT
eukprot:46775-Eustigmatos_ZCMA.PRE.1